MRNADERGAGVPFGGKQQGVIRRRGIHVQVLAGKAVLFRVEDALRAVVGGGLVNASAVRDRHGRCLLRILLRPGENKPVIIVVDPHIGDVADHAQCDRLVACHALSVHGHRFLRTGPLRKGGGAEGERHCQDQKDAECFFHRLFCPFLV